MESTRLKNTELKNLRALCQMVLDQRSDIEQFFLESIEQVKEEKRLKLEEELSKIAGPKQPDFLPLIEPGSKFSKKNFESLQQQSSLQGKKMTVELNDLDWEDRETVLRLLFSKMNTGEQASCWRDPSTNGSSRQTSTRGKTGIHDQGFMEEAEEEGENYDDELIYGDGEQQESQESEP